MSNYFKLWRDQRWWCDSFKPRHQGSSLLREPLSPISWVNASLPSSVVILLDASKSLIKALAVLVNVCKESIPYIQSVLTFQSNKKNIKRYLLMDRCPNITDKSLNYTGEGLKVFTSLKEISLDFSEWLIIAQKDLDFFQVSRNHWCRL